MSQSQKKVKCPSEEEPYMNFRQLEYFRRKLLSWRQQILKQSDETLNQIVEASIRESDAVDQGTLETHTALKLRTRDRYRNLIYKIDDAVERIENGTYGYCEETGEKIGIKRLEARPIATLCIEAQQWRERMVKRRIAY
jgi:DnaK suppressor protein